MLACFRGFFRILKNLFYGSSDNTKRKNITCDTCRIHIHTKHFVGLLDKFLDVTPEEKTNLIKKFEKVVESYYHTGGVPGRKNFLNFHFVTRKLLILEGLDQHSAIFNILMSPDKLKIHEEKWKVICEDLGWKDRS